MPAQQSSLLLSTCSACCPELQAPKVRGLLHVVASAHRTQPLGSSSQKQHQNSETGRRDRGQKQTGSHGLMRPEGQNSIMPSIMSYNLFAVRLLLPRAGLHGPWRIAQQAVTLHHLPSRLGLPWPRRPRPPWPRSRSWRPLPLLSLHLVPLPQGQARCGRA